MQIFLTISGITSTIDIEPEKDTINTIISKYLTLKITDLEKFTYLNLEINDYNEPLINLNIKENTTIYSNLTNKTIKELGYENTPRNIALQTMNIFKVLPKIIQKSNYSYIETVSSISTSNSLKNITLNSNRIKNKNEISENMLFEREKEEKFDTGIPQELAIDKNKFIDILKCEICLGIINDSVSCFWCQKNFCFECIKLSLKTNSKKCPNCRKLFKPQETDRTVKNFLECLEFHCYYFKRGCNEIISYNNFYNHISECEYGFYFCKSENCNFIGNKKEILEHIKNCGLKLIKCKYCKKDFEQIIIKKHENECGNKFSNCDLCSKLIKNKEIEEHKNNICEMKIIICENCCDKFLRKNKNEHTDIVCLSYQLNNVKKDLENEKNKRIEAENEIKLLFCKLEEFEKKLNEKGKK
jgi:hypothetical protein